MQIYAPGCALMIYKPLLANKVNHFLSQEIGDMLQLLTCCRHAPNVEHGTQIINTCAGCDKRYRELYNGITTISLWEILADSKLFPFPDYKGNEMAIHDACPTRSEERVHHAVRKLLARMNINVIEPSATRTQSVCCGDSFYGTMPAEQVKEQMKKRSGQMPCDDVVVYCISCIKAMHIGGKKPRYLIDLLFAEDTIIGTFEPKQWHDELQEFIDRH
ncbi:hypothetical protein SRRS_13370 [Sporomusa rhizae]|uniref:hypothetical protein n=1 Tax=Sporomusa rhizae TaxID=357999 RepID=UPI00352A9F9E